MKLAVLSNTFSARILTADERPVVFEIPTAKLPVTELNVTLPLLLSLNEIPFPGFGTLAALGKSPVAPARKPE